MWSLDVMRSCQSHRLCARICARATAEISAKVAKLADAPDLGLKPLFFSVSFRHSVTSLPPGSGGVWLRHPSLPNSDHAHCARSTICSTPEIDHSVESLGRQDGSCIHSPCRIVSNSLVSTVALSPYDCPDASFDLYGRQSLLRVSL
jgi:hypothetical protein